MSFSPIYINRKKKKFSLLAPLWGNDKNLIGAPTHTFKRGKSKNSDPTPTSLAMKQLPYPERLNKKNITPSSASHQDPKYPRVQINHLVMWISQCMDIFLSLTHSLSLILYLSYCKKKKQTNLFFQLFIWNLYIIIKNSKTECITYSKSKLLVTESQIFFFFLLFT